MDFCLLQKNMGTNLSSKYSKKLLDNAKKSTTHAIKAASKRAIQKTAEATGDLIGNKIADRITNVLKKRKTINQKQIATVRKTYQKKRYISPKEGQQIIDELS